MDRLNEWKDRWNDGDVKFVPEMFEEIERLCEVVKGLELVIEDLIYNRKSK